MKQIIFKVSERESNARNMRLEIPRKNEVEYVLGQLILLNQLKLTSSSTTRISNHNTYVKHSMSKKLQFWTLTREIRATTSISLLETTINVMLNHDIKRSYIRVLWELRSLTYGRVRHISKGCSYRINFSAVLITPVHPTYAMHLSGRKSISR